MTTFGERPAPRSCVDRTHSEALTTSIDMQAMTDENPYRFVATDPQEEIAIDERAWRPPPSGKTLPPLEIRRLAIAQRWLLICTAVVLVWTIVLVGLLELGVSPPQVADELGPLVFLPLLLAFGLFGLVSAVAYVAGLVFLFAAARRIHSILIGIVLLIPTLYFPLALPVVFYVHLRANSLLRLHGIRVGYLGADFFRTLPRTVGVTALSQVS